MTSRVSQLIEAHLPPRLRELYAEFDAACLADNWDRADDLMGQIMDASAAPHDYAFADTQSTELH